MTRTAVVTGASSGIGTVIARELAKQGWRIAIGARRTDRLAVVAEELRELGAEVVDLALDVSDPESIDAFFSASEQALGVADILVNNAGLARPALAQEYSVEQLQREIAVTFGGAMFVTRRALQSLLPAKKAGDIVFIGSDAAVNPRPGQLAYGAAKAGLENYASGLSLELEGTGVRVTTLRLGPTWSEFGFSWGEEDPAKIERIRAGWQRVGLRDARIPGQMLDPERVAEAVVFAVKQPPGVLIDKIELVPAAPRAGDDD